MSSTAILIENGYFGWENDKRTSSCLQAINIAVPRGKITMIVGPVGCGKSTLIKVLTGEVVPQSGKVEKHPNLRIGYIKQHALEHVEMHLEKTPNQYLQWRYANGDDREVMMKQTRVLTDEDRAQMDVTIDIGDGKGKSHSSHLNVTSANCSTQDHERLRT